MKIPSDSILTIEDMRKIISSIYLWLTLDEDILFFNNQKNTPTSIRSLEFAKQLKGCSDKSRLLLNKLSETMEDTAVCRKNLRYSIEMEKQEKKQSSRGKRRNVRIYRMAV